MFSDAKLNIPGEWSNQCFTATQFVGWFNGVPEYRLASLTLLPVYCTKTCIILLQWLLHDQTNKIVHLFKHNIFCLSLFLISRDLNPDLSSHIMPIIGHGNVSLDCARILAAPISHLEKTDISQHALDIIQQRRIQEINLYGRRGILQFKGTNGHGYFSSLFL